MGQQVNAASVEWNPTTERLRELAEKMPNASVTEFGNVNVKARVEGNQYTISIEGEVVAQGTEDRLPAGGIGFTSLPGEQARLYWARLTPLAASISEAAHGRPPRSIS